MTHTMTLQAQPFALMSVGEKTFELRLYDQKRKQIAVGDTIVFSNANNAKEQLTVRVKNLYIFSSFKKLYQTLPLDKCGYLPNEVSKASSKDMEKYYPLEKQKQYNVVGIEIELGGTAHATV